jgi:hypothetical protein
MANGDKPACEGSGLGATQFANTWLLLTTILAIIGGISTFVGLVTSTTTILLFGVLIPIALAAAAAGGGLGVFAIVLAGAYSKLAPQKGIHECYAGIATTVQEAFSDGWAIYFPFTAQHDRVDVVVKPIYWDVVERSPAQYVYCNFDSKLSPLIHTFFRTPEVVGAMAGSMYGAGIGAAIGIALGVAAGAAIGCVGVITIPICLLAMLIALLIAAGMAIAGAFIGGSVGRLAAGPSSPSGSAPGTNDKSVIRVGDYITVNANLIVYGEDNGAWAAWWAEHTTLHGHSTQGEGVGGSAPYNFADARDNLEPDACRPRTSGTPGGDTPPEPPR